MKYLFLFCLSVIALASCGDMRDKGQRTADAVNNSENTEWWRSEFKVVTIDGCEYLTYALGGRTGVMTHKGNCTNPIHKCPCQN